MESAFEQVLKPPKSSGGRAANEYVTSGTSIILSAGQ